MTAQPENRTRLPASPHCDSRILHGPSDGCAYCDEYPDWQALRKLWGIAFTGHQPRGMLPECGAKCAHPNGRQWKCRQAAGHDKGEQPTLHSPSPEWERMPCPADAARPQGTPADHRRWAGNKPTSADGDPSWPAETTASVILYGDKGGRERWPRRERIRRRARRPFEDWRKRRAGWRREGGWWRYP